MIPVLLEPQTQALLDLGEVNDAPYPIQLGSRADEVDAIVVPVQMTALALVPDDTVTHTDIVVALYCDHIYPISYTKIRHLAHSLKGEDHPKTGHLDPINGARARYLRGRHRARG